MPRVPGPGRPAQTEAQSWDDLLDRIERATREEQRGRLLQKCWIWTSTTKTQWGQRVPQIRYGRFDYLENGNYTRTYKSYAPGPIIAMSLQGWDGKLTLTELFGVNKDDEVERSYRYVMKCDQELCINPDHAVVLLEAFDGCIWSNLGGHRDGLTRTDIREYFIPEKPNA